MGEAKKIIFTINDELGEIPATSKNNINFLNSKNIYEWDDLGVDGRTETILKVKKFLTN